MGGWWGWVARKEDKVSRASYGMDFVAGNNGTDGKTLGTALVA
jgi:hypothetical protein